MPSIYLHDHRDFTDLLRILSDEMQIAAPLIEKDYWIMHALYGLTQLGLEFELKGETSLSKGFDIIDRFSEDIDIHIKPPVEMGVNEDPGKGKPKIVEGRKKYYDYLAEIIKIEGFTGVERDPAFDDTRYYRSGGIRLIYESKVELVPGLKDGILLEAGFDQITPNLKTTISSWAYEKAKKAGVDIIDNRALSISCYHPGYTFVEKLQTIATKFRQEQEDTIARPNLMRQYYDIYCLLENEDVKKFIGTEAYLKHKDRWFPKVDAEVPLINNEAFLLKDPVLRSGFKERYQATAALYYHGQPEFEEVLARIHKFLPNF